MDLSLIFNAKTKTTEKLILEALFADDCALMAHMESTFQLIVDKFAEASRLFGLTISLGKTEVLFQPSPPTADRRPSISIEGTELKTVEELSSPVYCMVVRPGPSTEDTLSCWSVSTCEACAQSWASNGRTGSQTLRSWIVQKPPALRL